MHRFTTLRPRTMITLVVALIALVGGFALAQTPTVQAAMKNIGVMAVPSIPATFNYQGYLRETDGSLTTGTYTIIAKIYDQPTAGNLLHTEMFNNVNVRDGLFNIVLGSQVNLGSTFDATPRFIGITLGNGTEFIPRERVHGVPWAIYATTAANATTATTASNASFASNAGNATNATNAVDAQNLTVVNIAHYEPSNPYAWPLAQTVNLTLKQDSAAGDAMCFLTHVRTLDGAETNCGINNDSGELFVGAFNNCHAMCIQWDR